MTSPTEGPAGRPDTPTDPSRRRVLHTALAAGVLALPVASCTGPDDKPRPGATKSAPARRPAPDPDLPVLDRAAENESRLLASYAATVARHPDLEARLGAFAARHQQHLEALTAAAHPDAAPAAPVATASPDATATAGVPGSGAEAVARLSAAERLAATGRDSDVRAVKGSEHARLLASIAACEATHVAALGGGLA